MIQEQAFIPQILSHRGNKILENILAIFVGVLSLSLLAQIAIPIPWTPVPITGQTFGIALISLLWGRNRSFAVVFSYLFIGALGFPIFAFGKSGLVFGPTFGYLIGMLAASVWMGFLADRGWTRAVLHAFRPRLRAQPRARARRNSAAAALFRRVQHLVHRLPGESAGID